MKKTYVTPTTVATGDAARETMSGSPVISESGGFNQPGAGSIGFNL